MKNYRNAFCTVPVSQYATGRFRWTLSSDGKFGICPHSASSLQPSKYNSNSQESEHHGGDFQFAEFFHPPPPRPTFHRTSPSFLPTKNIKIKLEGKGDMLLFNSEGKGDMLSFNLEGKGDMLSFNLEGKGDM
jgi:hypothetical protein